MNTHPLTAQPYTRAGHTHQLQVGSEVTTVSLHKEATSQTEPPQGQTQSNKRRRTPASPTYPVQHIQFNISSQAYPVQHTREQPYLQKHLLKQMTSTTRNTQETQQPEVLRATSTQHHACSRRSIGGNTPSNYHKPPRFLHLNSNPIRNSRQRHDPTNPTTGYATSRECFPSPDAQPPHLCKVS